MRSLIAPCQRRPVAFHKPPRVPDGGIIVRNQQKCRCGCIVGYHDLAGRCFYGNLGGRLLWHLGCRHSRFCLVKTLARRDIKIICAMRFCVS